MHDTLPHLSYPPRFMKKVPYNIITEFRKPTKLVMLMQMCLNIICNKVRRNKYLSDDFSIQNNLKQEVLSPLFLNFALEYVEDVGLEVNTEKTRYVFKCHHRMQDKIIM
jgi:hypothetical protein